MKFNILTLFPEMFEPLSGSMLGRASDNGILTFNIVNIRDYTTDKHNRVDDTPYGGGVGMVMFCQPVFDCLNDINPEKKGKMIYMSPRGKLLDRETIERLKDEEEITILCGHYEGVDQRIIDAYDMEEISIGDYILTGGELPAMVLIDAVSRFIPGVLGESQSCTEESIYTGLLEANQYTKPREYEGMAVPEILTSGNHEAISLWQWEESLKLTKKTRPDLFDSYKEKVLAEGKLSKKEQKILKEIEEN